MMTETVVQVEQGRPQNTGPPPPKPDGQQQTQDPLSWIAHNTAYFQTVPGVLKLIQLLLGILCMALATPYGATSTELFLTVVILAFIFTLLWVAAYYLGVREVLNLAVNWILTELINTGIFTILYALTTLFHLIFAVKSTSNIFAAVFGLFNTAAYGASSFYLIQDYKAGATH